MQGVYCGGGTELRHHATNGTDEKDFNGVTLDSDDALTVLAAEEVEGQLFYRVRYGRKQGWLKAQYFKHA